MECYVGKGNSEAWGGVGDQVVGGGRRRVLFWLKQG